VVVKTEKKTTKKRNKRKKKSKAPADDAEESKPISDEDEAFLDQVVQQTQE